MESTPDPIRVLIADDHPVFGEALRAILTADPRLEVVGVARDGREAVHLATTLRPDVTLMDISMPGMDGFEATRRVREQIPEASVLMLTGSNARTDVDRARTSGAAGYVTKDRISADLVDTILAVLAE